MDLKKLVLKLLVSIIQSTLDVAFGLVKIYSEEKRFNRVNATSHRTEPVL